MYGEECVSIMDRIVDFSNCTRAHVSYGGSDRKFAVIYNDNVYMLKFAKNHARLSDISINHVNNAISEYIGSHISQSIGLPTHETVLGTYNDEVVIGCVDFRGRNNATIIEFSEYVRAKYNSCDIKQSIELNQLYETLHDPHNEIPDTLQNESVKRYWDMFVVDALVGNSNRHSSDWGFLLKNGKLELAPVYDFGSSLFPSVSDDIAYELLNNHNKMMEECLISPFCSLLINNEKVGYYDMMSSKIDKNCTEAVIRMAHIIDLAKINEIIDDTQFISDIRKSFYKEVINMRHKLIIMKSYKRCQST